MDFIPKKNKRPWSAIRDTRVAILLEHNKHKKFDINRTKIKGGCQSGRKVVTHNSKSDLPLAVRI